MRKLTRDYVKIPKNILDILNKQFSEVLFLFLNCFRNKKK